MLGNSSVPFRLHFNLNYESFLFFFKAYDLSPYDVYKTTSDTYPYAPEPSSYFKTKSFSLIDLSHSTNNFYAILSHSF